MDLTPVFNQIEKRKEKAIADLADFIAIPSVSAKEEYLEEAAEYSAKILKENGFLTKIHQTAGGPVVTAEMDVGAKRTLMFYDHADVQPAEPFDLWDSPPFQLDIRDDKMFGRGVADNKGEIVCRVHAIRSWLDAGLDLPTNIRFVIETEEESSSKHLEEYVRKDRAFFKDVDGCIWEFGGSNRKGLQEFVLGVKGILYIQLSVQTMTLDSHSANATHLPNAGERLLAAIGLLKDNEGKIKIPQFYDDVISLTDEEKKTVKEYDFYPEEILKQYGLTNFNHELPAEKAKLAYFSEPTCNLCGFTTGWQGEGGKTVIPKQAIAKLDFRLVKNQNPEKILKNIRKFLDQTGYSDVKIDWWNGYPPSKTAINNHFVTICKKANEVVYNHQPTIQINSGGSGPMYLFGDHMPVVSLGCGHANSNAHAPNENIFIDDFIDGMKMIAAVIQQFESW
jgi:acetylornithine deacetylase/succinyl-diaminopimelate desuccinylase-like protein